MNKYDKYADRIVEHNGNTWKIDFDGYLTGEYVLSLNVNPGVDWYDYVRIKYGIPELTAEHIEILGYYQKFYRNNGIAPPISIATRELKKSRDSIVKLFSPSKDPIKTIIIMAGLSRPRGYPANGPSVKEWVGDVVIFWKNTKITNNELIKLRRLLPELSLEPLKDLKAKLSKAGYFRKEFRSSYFADRFIESAQQMGFKTKKNEKA